MWLFCTVDFTVLALPRMFVPRLCVALWTNKAGQSAAAALYVSIYQDDAYICSAHDQHGLIFMVNK